MMNRFVTVLALAAPLAIASPMAPRETTDKPSCFERTSAIKEWEVKDLDFHAEYVFTTPAHQNSWGYVSFNLVNPVLDATVNCNASSSRLNDFFYGDTHYICDDEGVADLAGTEFTFDRANGEVTVQQSWYCYDDPEYPARLTAKGDATVDLSCEEETWENGNWTIGDIYSRRDVTCDLADLSVPVKEISAVAR